MRAMRALAAAAVWLLPALATANDQAAQVFSSASPSVYSVLATARNGAQMLGSAVVVGQGRLATNHHVIANAERIVVRQGDEEREAVLESSDPAHDLALLHAPGLAGAAAVLGDSTRLRIGQTVYAIGSPRGLELSLSEGLVSSLRKTPDGAAIQTTAAISPGSSGGGLFDAQGRLLGLTTAQVINGQNLNFAVPVEWLRFVGLRATATSEASAAAVDPARTLPAPVLETAVATAQSPPPQPAPAARKAPPVSKAPNLYVGTALIVILLFAAKPAINWLSEFMARDAPLPEPPRVIRSAAAKDRTAPFRAQALEELRNHARDADTWRQALESCNGDESRATAAYIELRSATLHRADMDRRWNEARQSNVHPGAPPERT